MTTWLKAITVALALTGLKVLLASQDATAGLTDDTITARVQQEFRFNVQLRDADIHVSTSQGIVTLKGVVSSYLEQQRARQYEIQVQSSSDESILSAVFNRLRSDWRINAIWVEVSVEHQIVRLYGYVESPMQKDLAENRVRSLPEVRDVQNHLTVAHSPTSRLSR
jgi:osmotically-inducible protein OsmY